MENNSSVDEEDEPQQAERTDIILLDDETEEEVGAISRGSPPVPSVGDLVNINTLSFGMDEETEHKRSENDMSFRVVDREIQYATGNAKSGNPNLTTKVCLYVVSKEEWATRRQRGT